MGFPSVNYGGQEQPRPKKAFRDSGFANVLGMLGDALLVHGGRAPMYAPMRQQRMDEQRQEKANQAIGNYLGNLDPALRELIMQAGPGAGMKAYEMAHPQAKDPPGMIQEFRLREQMSDAERGEYDNYVEKRRFNPYGAPITLGPGDTYEAGGDEPPAANGDAPAVSSQEEYDALPPGAVYLGPDGKPRHKGGGPTAGPSGGFL